MKQNEVIRRYKEALDELSQDGQQLEHGEDIEVTWMSPDDVRSAIENGRMQEWRSAGVLLGTVLPRV